MLAILNLSAYMCAILILSLIVWLISGNKMLYNILIPKPPEDPVKKYIKYVGGGIISAISSLIKFIGRIFVIPTQDVFRAGPDNYWLTYN